MAVIVETNVEQRWSRCDENNKITKTFSIETGANFLKKNVTQIMYISQVLIVLSRDENSIPLLLNSIVNRIITV